MFVDAASEAEPQQRGVKLLVPSPWSLTESVQHLVELKHLVFVLAVDEPRWLLDVYFLLELPIQERRFDVHVMDAPAVVRCDGEEQAHRLQSSDGSEHLFEVDAGTLHVALGDKAGFVFDDAPVLVALHFVHPFQPDGSVSAWKFD